MWFGSKFTSLSDYLFRSLFKLLFRYDIFISYARRDGKEYALKLRDQLKQLDFSCFLDADELPPGNSLNSTLKRALRRSATLVVVGTERATRSRYVELEVGEFTGTGRAVIPIDIEGTLADAPWGVLKERDIVWIDEARAALERGVPSPNVADQIDKLFKYTRRNSRVRAQVLATILLFVLVVLGSLFAIRQQVHAATAASAEAERQKTEAKNQKTVADAASVEAAEQRHAADAAAANAADAERKSEASLKKALTAEKAAGEATAEAKKQERAALANAARARSEQTIAEERTRYVVAEQMGVQSNLAFDSDYWKGDDFERRTLLSIESLKRAMTPEGYSAWTRSTALLPRAAAPPPALAVKNVAAPTAVAYSSDGQMFAVGSDGEVALFQTSSAVEPVRWRLNGRVKVVSFGADNSWLAASSDVELRVWDTKSHEAIKSLKGFRAESIAFSPDGRYVAMANREVTAKVFDTRDWSVVAQPGSAEAGIFMMCVGFSPDSRWLATGIRGGKIKLWRVADFGKAAGEALVPVETAAAEATLYQITFSPKGNFLAAMGTTNHGVGVWAVSMTDDGTPSLSKITYETEIKSDAYLPLAFSPAEDYLVTSGTVASVWDLQGGREVARVFGPKGVAATAFRPDGRAFVTATENGLEFWEASFGSDTLRADSGRNLNALSVSRDGRFAATASSDGLRVFEVEGLRLAARPGDAVNVSRVAFSGDGRWLAALSGNSLKIFDTARWAEVKSLAQSDEPGNIGFSPDSRWLVMLSGATVKLFEVGTWAEARTFTHKDRADVVTFSKDGRRLAVFTLRRARAHVAHSERSETYVWDVASGRPLACKTFSGTPEPPSAEGARTEGAAVVCSDLKGREPESLWSEIDGWKPLEETAGSKASDDGLWRIEEGTFNFTLSIKEGNGFRQVASFPLTGASKAALITPGSRWLLGVVDDSIMLWPLKPADMIDAACSRLLRRDLTAEERRQYISDGATQPTCPASH